MYRRLASLAALLSLALAGLISGPTHAARQAASSTLSSVAFAPVGTYRTGLGPASAEIAAWSDDRLYVTNSASNTLDIVDVRDPSAPTLLRRIDLSPYGAGPNSVAVRPKAVAVAMEAAPKTDPGKVIFFSRDGQYLNQVTVGALPDMLTYSLDGRYLVVANEGEPNSYGRPDSVDPEGTISVIDMRGNPLRLTQADVATIDFRAFNAGGPRAAELPPGVRIFGPGASVAQDLEPEYISITPGSETAYVSLQENNALAVIDLRARRVDRILALGTKDHAAPGSGLDASDRDGRINIATWPVRGMYQPDALASFRLGRESFVVSANEGDARDYPGFSEEVRVGSSGYRLDPAVFPNAADLKKPENLGRLTVTTATGKDPVTGLFREIDAFGGRSFSVWSGDGRLLWDSGDQLERITAALLPANFNADHESNTFDNRSDNKGPEPEGLAIGPVGDRLYAFVALERIGGLMIYDITNPRAPQFVQYTTNRDFSGAAPAGDLGPEGVTFVPAGPNRPGPLVIVSNEISGTVTIYGPIDPNGAGTLTLLHNNDGESSLLPLQNAVRTPGGPVTLDVAGVAAFKTLTDQQIRAARASGNAVVNVYAGDSVLASAALSCSLPPNPPGTPIYDAVAQRQIPYDAHIFGNHEFDFGPGFLERFVRSFAVNGVLVQPFLSANLNFSGEPTWADLLDADGLLVGASLDGRVVARSAIVTDRVTGQRFGVVGATTPLLPTISSPGRVTVTPDTPATAAVVQQEIDRLREQYGLRKILFVSHLQDVDNDRALVKLLRGVDIAVAGGGDELLVNPAIPNEIGLLPGEQAPIEGTYPLTETDADGRTVYIVTTAGNYKYLGRIDATFDANGEVVRIDAATSYPRRVIPTSATAAQLGLADAVAPDPGIQSSVIAPVQACLAALAQPIIRTEVLLDVSRAGSRSRETNAGNSIADAYLAAYDRYAAANGLPPRGPGNPVIAVQNGGGIRQNAGDVLPTTGVVPGTISRLDTRNVLAFFNLMSVVQQVTPADLKSIMERSAASLPGQGGQFLQIGGFRVVIDTTRPAQIIQTDGTVTTPGDRVRSITLDDGRPIVADGAVVPGAPNVALITNSFTAGGGDNYPWLRDNPNKTQIFDDQGTVVTYESAWVAYLLSFPAGGSPALPTIPASDPRYRPGGEGRITFAS
jgi:2',3'-cyclic-nucleotide 2'-phosphodiesterase (5'-nucleotidase family)